jgi:formylglycine-generating enzyme required for sulfatase activity
MPQNLSLYRYRRKNQSYTEDLGSGVSLTLMVIPAGEFMMGAPVGEPGSIDLERPPHPVQVPQFLLGRYPVTQAQWRMVVGYEQGNGMELVGHDPSTDPAFSGDDRPAVNVRWQAAQEFCRRLAAKAGKKYRLPSEAEWEYACRAGTTTPFHFGATISPELANYDGRGAYNDGPQGEYRQRTMDVGAFPANGWGLHDMHGNVLEWCEDAWYSSYEDSPRDGSAWTRSAPGKVLRGGAWYDSPFRCRSAVRTNYDEADNIVGFRVVCELPSIPLSS